MIDLFSDAPIGNPKAAGIDNAEKDSSRRKPGGIAREQIGR